MKNEDNAFSIAQGHCSKHAWMRAIYADEAPVGFMMLRDDPDEPEYYLMAKRMARRLA